MIVEIAIVLSHSLWRRLSFYIARLTGSTNRVSRKFRRIVIAAVATVLIAVERRRKTKRISTAGTKTVTHIGVVLHSENIDW